MSAAAEVIVVSSDDSEDDDEDEQHLVSLISSRRCNHRVSSSPSVDGPSILCGCVPFPVHLLSPCLSHVTLVLLIDLDNWPSFFLRLPHHLPEHVFVWCFVGSNTTVNLPADAIDTILNTQQQTDKPLSPFSHLCSFNHVMLTLCGNRKNSSDFAMSVKIGTLHSSLPLNIPFCICSGDKNMDEISHHLPGRVCRRVDPHQHTHKREKDKRETDTDMTQDELLLNQLLGLT